MDFESSKIFLSLALSLSSLHSDTRAGWRVGMRERGKRKKVALLKLDSQLAL